MKLAYALVEYGLREAAPVVRYASGSAPFSQYIAARAHISRWLTHELAKEPDMEPVRRLVDRLGVADWQFTLSNDYNSLVGNVIVPDLFIRVQDVQDVHYHRAPPVATCAHRSTVCQDSAPNQLWLRLRFDQPDEQQDGMWEPGFIRLVREACTKLLDGP